MSGERNIYLSDVPLDAAIARWHAALAARGLLAPLGSERIPLRAAAGRVTAEPVWARISSPHYHACAMDGYAVLSEETIGATETAPLKLAMGTQAHPVDTGDPLPHGTNAVIMIEQVEELDGAIEITAAVPPWQYVRAMGEDVVATELVLPANHRLRPQDLGAMAASGHGDVNVHRRPRVALIPTGTELVPPGRQVRAGDIIEFNTLVLGAMAEEAGCDVTRWDIVRDDYDALRAAVQHALQTHDLVAINAGSSAGREDFTSRVVAELGELCVHGIAIRPGHPVILGAAGADAQARALVGIPGYPVSAVVTFDLLMRPLLLRWQGILPPQRPKLAATLTRKVVSPPGDDEFVRVTLGRVGERVVATPLTGGAGVITSLVKADGVLLVPRFSEGFHAGAQVEVELHCAPEKIDNTIVAIGSHDMALDLLADAIKRVRPDLTLSSAHVGSIGGLLALQRGEAHLAGSHLLDEASGEYNLAAIRQMLAPHGVRVKVLGFVERVQGLIVSKGNPLGLGALADLTRSDVIFVNRQRGAGTRVLLDFQLDRNGIDPSAVRGYERQEYTHLAVAAAVASGVATCGLGILAAARALDLDFVPLFNERYDLLVPAQHFDSAKLQPLLAIIGSEDFRRAVDARGGYGVARMGEVLAEL
jgi:putative molybdopterin biosynthesis protein